MSAFSIQIKTFLIELTKHSTKKFSICCCPFHKSCCILSKLDEESTIYFEIIPDPHSVLVGFNYLANLVE